MYVEQDSRRTCMCTPIVKLLARLDWKLKHNVLHQQHHFGNIFGVSRIVFMHFGGYHYPSTINILDFNTHKYKLLWNLLVLFFYVVLSLSFISRAQRRRKTVNGVSPYVNVCMTTGNLKLTIEWSFLLFTSS